MTTTRLRLLALTALFAIGCFYHHDHVIIVRGPNISIADLNVDGFADVVVGAPLDDGGGAPGSERGAVYVYFGSANGPSATPNLTIFGKEDGAHFGAAIAFVGDVNAHGAPDLLVGAPLDDGDDNSTDDGIDRGRAFIFFGGPAMDATPDVVMTGAEANAQFGTSVARAGDINFDGIDDWLVGAPFDDGDDNATDEGTDRGRAFLFFGRPTPNNVPDVVFTGPEEKSEFGFAVASAGDINHGGADDVAIGAPLDDGDDNGTDDGIDRGRVYVYYGGSALDTTPDLVLTGDEDGARFGAAVAPVFDVNGDRIDDLLVGAPLHDAGGGAGADRGRAYVFFGGANPAATPGLTISGTRDGGHFGAAVARAGDVNGDGERDFLVGAPLEDPAGLVDAGSAYLFFGGPALDDVADLVFDGAEAGAQFGAALSGSGDVNGGGRDIEIGAPLDDADGNATDDGLDRGSVFVFFGGPALDAVPDATIAGTHDGAHFGAALAN